MDRIRPASTKREEGPRECATGEPHADAAHDEDGLGDDAGRRRARGEDRGEEPRGEEGG